MPIPPYAPVKSKAQARKLFQLVSIGEMSSTEARGKVRAANWSKLPQHVKTAGHPAQNLGRHLHPKGGLK